MLTVALLYNLLPLLLMISIIIFTRHKLLPIGLMALVYLIAFGITYFRLTSKNLLSIIWGNLVYGIIYTVIIYFLLNFEKKAKVWQRKYARRRHLAKLLVLQDRNKRCFVLEA